MTLEIRKLTSFARARGKRVLCPKQHKKHNGDDLRLHGVILRFPVRHLDFLNKHTGKGPTAKREIITISGIAFHKRRGMRTQSPRIEACLPGNFLMFIKPQQHVSKRSNISTRYETCQVGSIDDA